MDKRKKTIKALVEDSGNAYGIESFNTVKCVRCKNTYLCNTNSHGFCSHCDNGSGFYIGSYKKELLSSPKIVAFPAELIND